VGKISNEPKFAERAITNLEDIMNQTADVASEEPNKSAKEEHHQSSGNAETEM
jgi:hypothetical protein